ncbi:hypothetical protein, partial [Serratia marcescens]|uniref:hypothetical protein n=1 Tax=Serratia marcescens TaxID=615 RepID=UPI002813EA29
IKVNDRLHEYDHWFFLRTQIPLKKLIFRSQVKRIDLVSLEDRIMSWAGTNKVETYLKCKSLILLKYIKELIVNEQVAQPEAMLAEML